MSLIDDDDRVIRQQEIFFDLAEQNTIGHELDLGLVRHVALVSDLVANDVPAQVELLADPLGHGRGGDPPWFGDSNLGMTCVSSFIEELWDLCSFAASSLTYNDDFID